MVEEIKPENLVVKGKDQAVDSQFAVTIDDCTNCEVILESPVKTLCYSRT